METQSERMARIRESRELDITGLNEAELMERDMRNQTKWFVVSQFLGDSTAWMETAVLMNDSSIRTAPAGYPVDENRSNVAHVATGYAYELLMKSIANADDAKVEAVHSVKQVFAKLGEGRKQEIRKAMAKHGVRNTESYFGDVDARFCHKDRKYGMIGPDMRSATGGIFSDLVAGGRLSIDRLARIHQEIADIGRRALKEWENIRSKERAAIIQAIRSGGAKAKA